MRDHNDLEYDKNFFVSRGRVKNPKPLKASKLSVETPSDLVKKKKKTKGNAYQFTKTGSRSDLDGIVCRSSWESNVLRILKLYQIQFEFEPTTFEFPPDARGRHSAYIPDIYLIKSDEYIEVKGMLDARGRNKLRKFRKHFPEEFKRLTVIISKSNKTNKFFFAKLGVENVLYYEHLTKLFASKIPNWEGHQ